MYKTISAAFCVLSILLTAACTGITERSNNRAQTQSARAQEALVKQRLDLVEQYQTCVAEAGADTAAVEACDVYLRSAEALS